MSTHMKWRPEQIVVPLLVILSASNALAQPAADIVAVKAARKAFYDAVVVIDDGTAMEKVWAHT
jgi:hypothetical protein